MKFMVINNRSGNEQFQRKPGQAREFAEILRGLLKRGDLEVCYSTAAGGHIYVFSVETIEELHVAVRKNPLFSGSHTEVIPISDTVDFLEGYATYRERKPGSKREARAS